MFRAEPSRWLWEVEPGPPSVPRWAENGVIKLIFSALRGAIASWCVMIDGTVRRVHRKAAGARKDRGPQAIGRSRRGLTTKTVALVDVLGQLIDFIPLPGQARELKKVEALIEGVRIEAFIADKAYDADWLVDKLLELNPGRKVVVPSKSNRKTSSDHDDEMYELRRRVEKFFGKVKEKRGIASRCDKTDSSCEALWHLAGTLEILNLVSTGPGYPPRFGRKS